MTKTSKWLVGIFSFLFIFIGFFIIIIISVFFFDSDTEEISTGSGATIAVVEIIEPIISSDNIVRQIKKFRNNASVKAIVLRIESPGGGVSASQEIYEEVRKTRELGKPVVVSIGSIAASGGYYIAVGATRIVANPGSITGSIGVISQFMHVDDLLAKIGVSSTTIKSGPLKDSGSPFRKATAEDKKYFQEMIDDIYDQFVATVALERKLDTKIVKSYADGRVFTGRKAYALHLVDSLGTYEDAIKIAGSLSGIEGTPHVVKERKKEKLSELIFGEMKSGFSAMKEELFNQPIVQYRYRQQQ